MLKIVSLQLRALLTRGTRLYRATLVAGLGAFAALAAALIYQASVGPAHDPAQATRVLAALADNWLITLGLFGAVALGYCYWALDLLAGVNAERGSRGLRLAAEVLFVLAGAAAVAALLAWNLALL